ncbi:hypothetical protein FEM48_Zijuj02G0068400 [Ziziphus jujuba var. spinosa]|uniref:Uncharacterized protein n=1 Tax=Ziziphus jujuba var. spinosa TaxID=714518 RepID=A0A978VU95_ZIZJJ|nr:hypothetical protein FEM48_Zijuj02G0068400 [Ziziphus jujuba var. spinosa]
MKQKGHHSTARDETDCRRESGLIWAFIYIDREYKRMATKRDLRIIVQSNSSRSQQTTISLAPEKSLPPPLRHKTPYSFLFSGFPMEGLIPFVYKVIVQYKNGNQENMAAGSSYIRLPSGTSGSTSSGIQLFLTECIFSSTSAMSPIATSNLTSPPAIQSPLLSTSGNVFS